MSDRRHFLKQLAAFAVVGPSLKLGEWAPVRDDFLAVVQKICFPALGYNVPGAWLSALAKTGEADKYMVRVRGQSGLLIVRPVLISQCAKTVAPWSKRSELAYQIARRVKEASRDIAHTEGIDWRRNEREWYASVAPWRDA